MRPPKPGKGKKKIKTTDEGGRGKYKKYTSADMVNAVSAVVNGTHSFRAAVQSFRVPKTSLQRNVATARKARSMTSFSNLVIFTEEEEAQMVAAIIRRGKAALPWTVKALRRKPLDLESNAEISRTFTVVAEARLEASGAKELTESECISLLCSKSTLLKATVTDSYGNKLVIPACSPWEKAVSKERNRRSFERAGYPNGDTRQWDVNPEAIRNKVYQTIKEQKEGGAIAAVNTIAQTEGAAEPETAIESILDSNVTGIPSDPLQLLAHVVCVSGLPDVKSAAVKRTYQQIMHHQRETERLRQELIVQNLPEHPPICEVLALTPDKDKCSKRYKMPGRRRIMGEDAQMLCGERAMRALFTKWLKKTVGHALRRWRAMAKETARHKLAQERARDKEHHARRMAQKAAIRVQVKARAEMEKRRAAAAAKAEKAARQAERKRAEAAARRVAAAAKAAAKNKALLEKEDEKLRQAAQKEARATDAITEQQEVLDGLQASMALATEHTQNTTEVRSALYMDCCLHGE
eukprot:jgi/Tetstr1/456678/TSEL_043379.t1